MKLKNLLITGGFFAVVAICLPMRSDGKAKGSPSAEAESSAASSVGASPAKMHAMAFKGMIASVDDKAKTFTIAGKDTSRVLKITEKTIITKGGQPATMKEVVANEEVRGSYYKMPDGSMDYRRMLVDYIGERARSRLFEMCEVVRISPLVRDYRIRNAIVR